MSSDESKTPTTTPERDPNVVQEWPNFVGAFSRGQEPDALPNGTLVQRCNSQDGEYPGNGTTGPIMGSLRTPDGALWYWVDWWYGDQPALCPAAKLEEAK